MAAEVQGVLYAETIGGASLPSVLATGYGIYLLAVVDSQSTNGWILTMLGLLSFFSVMASSKWPIAALTPFVLGLYTFAVLGCLGLGLALSEGSGIWAVASSIFWALFGWYTLSRITRYRRILKAFRTTERQAFRDDASRGRRRHSGEDSP